MIDKECVKNSFKKNLSTYNDNAIVQKKMASKLISLCPKKDFYRILEIGAGTGLLTELIVEKNDYKQFYINDIVKECCGFIDTDEKKIFIEGDFDSVEFPINMDLIISNAALQWSSDKVNLIKKIAMTLTSEGIFAFSTFSTQNYREIEKITGISLTYLSISEMSMILSEFFDIVHISEDVHELEFDSFKDLLRHIRLTGVNAISSKKMCVSDLKNMEKSYKQNYYQGDKFMLTYNPMYVIASKRF